MPASFSEFTLALWIRPTGNMGGNEGIAGERHVVCFRTKDKEEITLVTFASGNVTFDWNVPNHSWHHIAAVGDGEALRIFLDGSLVATRSQIVSAMCCGGGFMIFPGRPHES